MEISTNKTSNEIYNDKVKLKNDKRKNNLNELIPCKYWQINEKYNAEMNSEKINKLSFHEEKIVKLFDELRVLKIEQVWNKFSRIAYSIFKFYPRLILHFYENNIEYPILTDTENRGWVCFEHILKPDPRFLFPRKNADINYPPLKHKVYMYVKNINNIKSQRYTDISSITLVNEDEIPIPPLIADLEYRNDHDILEENYESILLSRELQCREKINLFNIIEPIHPKDIVENKNVLESLNCSEDLKLILKYYAKYDLSNHPGLNIGGYWSSDFLYPDWKIRKALCEEMLFPYTITTKSNFPIANGLILRTRQNMCWCSDRSNRNVLWFNSETNYTGDWLARVTLNQDCIILEEVIKKH